MSSPRAMFPGRSPTKSPATLQQPCKEEPPAQTEADLPSRTQETQRLQNSDNRWNWEQSLRIGLQRPPLRIHTPAYRTAASHVLTSTYLPSRKWRLCSNEIQFLLRNPGKLVCVLPTQQSPSQCVSNRDSFRCAHLTCSLSVLLSTTSPAAFLLLHS